jgi:hypothetical protein
MDSYVYQLQTLHWTVWLAVGFVVGLAVLLIGMRLWSAWWRYWRRGAALAAYRERAKESAAAGKSDRILISDAESVSPPVSGQVLECSAAKISLRVADSVNRGTILTWRPVGVPAAFGWASVEVKKSSRDGQYWKLACRFIRTPPWVTRFLRQDILSE